MRAVSGPDSSVWVSVLGHGVSHYDTNDDVFVPLKSEDLPDEWLKQVVDMGSKDGLLYLLGADGKVVCLLNEKVVFTKDLKEPRQMQLHQFVSLGANYYLFISGEAGALQIISMQDMGKSIQLLNPSESPVSSISQGLGSATVWIGTDLGNIFKLTLDDNTFISTNVSDKFAFLAKDQRKILDITETEQDLIWIATDGDGVYKFLNRTRAFYSLSAKTKDKSGLSNSIVRAVYENSEGKLYVGTRSGGLNIIEKNKQNRVVDITGGLSSNTVLAIKEDLQKNVWIGVDGEGIDMLEAGTEKIYHFPRDFENANELQFGNVYTICIDAFGTLWLGTSGYGVLGFKVKKLNGGYFVQDVQQITFTEAGNKNSINSNVVYSIAEEKPNILWFGTRGAGLYRYNSLSQSIEAHFSTQAALPQRLNNDDVLSLLIDQKRSKVWVGTSGGLNQITIDTKPYQSKSYTAREGLPNQTIHAILLAPDNILWLSTNKGLAVYDPETSKYKTYDSNDGLLNNEYTDGASFHAELPHRLYFGGINGLDIIYPLKMETITTFPQLYLHEFKINNLIISPLDSSAVLKRNLTDTDSITLKYNQNFISFQLTTLTYWNKKRIQHAYFLENFQEEWNYIDQRSLINLTNIPPGHYLLHVKQTNENGEWNDEIKTVALTVRPPFWRSNWAYGFYVFLLIALQIVIVLIVRQRNKTKRAITINQLKVRQMKELNDYKLEFFTNVAHEFRTPLTLIIGPVANLIKKVTGTWESEQLKTVYSNSLRLHKLIEELIQFRSIESGKEKPEVQPIEVVAFTQQIVETFQQHAYAHDISLEFTPEPESFIAWVDPGKIERILINVISNAIKYNSAGGNVVVSVAEKEGSVIFKVKDDGIGIDAGDQERIFERFFHYPTSVQKKQNTFLSTGIGLSLTKSLIELHHGTIRLDSELNKGSAFTIEIPARANDYGQKENSVEAELSFLISREDVAREFQYTNSFTDEDDETKLPNEDTFDKTKEHSLLLVDDQIQILGLMKDILGHQYRIHTATNGLAALKILDSEKVDLVISDVLMPGMDGFKLCKNIKDNIETTHIPVILLTAKAEIEDRIEGLQMGADSYIPKPFHPEHLFISIESLIEKNEKIKERFEKFTEFELDKIETGISRKDDEFFVLVTQSIEKHLSEPELSAEMIAHEVGMSKASLYKKVKSAMGITPHGLIKKYRLRKAADLLKKTDMSVSEVIYETGFNSRSYFYKSFNEMYKCHPKDFKNSIHKVVG
jgi:signal transduction histidine kinase/DNA-binding response OmpR family regulator